MKRSEEILKKVTIQGIADYLLGVESKKRESINCDERLENAISEFEAVVKKTMIAFSHLCRMQGLN